MQKRITIFTPTYNRGHLLNRCYESLLKQKNKQFIWLIIDDGSIDNTRKIVNKWKLDNFIEIRYIYKENGGLHTGYNKAIELLDTELSICIDSDDYLADNAIQLILDFWDVNHDEECAGIVGLDYNNNGNVIGGYLPDKNRIDPLELLISKQKGDKKYVVRTDLYKTVAPMPTFENEKNFNPHYMILKLGIKYKFLVLNKPLCIVDYQEDGMSANIFKQYLDSPNSFAELRRLIMTLPNIPFTYLCRTTIHYISSNIIAKNKEYINKSPKKVITIILIPFGYLLANYIKRNSKKKVNIK